MSEAHVTFTGSFRMPIQAHVVTAWAPATDGTR